MNRPHLLDQAHQYIEKSRSPLYSFLMVIPLLCLYEFLILRTGSSVRNGADVLMKNLLSLLGVEGMIGFTVLIFSAFCWVVWRDTVQGNEHVRGHYFGLMALEALLYAIVIGPLVAQLTERILYPKLASAGAVKLQEQLIVSLGAGIYEEFVFRFLLVTALVFSFHRFMDMPRWASVAFAVFWASVFFSGFHYVGAYAYEFQFSTFTFRFIAGAVLALLFYFRGFGIVVYAHSAYDILISLALIR